ncbi:hypothetical protein BJV74DRAFT_990817 [Russula compacta]|nr:hypothetical protein BJV74DRAFT_990817 [Russula compacta]
MLTKNRCGGKFMKEVDGMLKQCHDLIVASSEFTEGPCLLFKDFIDSLNRVTAVELDGKWMSEEVAILLVAVNGIGECVLIGLAEEIAGSLRGRGMAPAGEETRTVNVANMEHRPNLMFEENALVMARTIAISGALFWTSPPPPNYHLLPPETIHSASAFRTSANPKFVGHTYIRQPTDRVRLTRREFQTLDLEIPSENARTTLWEIVTLSGPPTYLEHDVQNLMAHVLCLAYFSPSVKDPVIVSRGRDKVVKEPPVNHELAGRPDIFWISAKFRKYDSFVCCTFVIGCDLCFLGVPPTHTSLCTACHPTPRCSLASVGASRMWGPSATNTVVSNTLWYKPAPWDLKKATGIQFAIAGLTVNYLVVQGPSLAHEILKGWFPPVRGALADKSYVPHSGRFFRFMAMTTYIVARSSNETIKSGIQIPDCDAKPDKTIAAPWSEGG